MNLQCIQFFYAIALLTRVIDAKSLGGVDASSALDSIDQLTDVVPGKAISRVDDRQLVQSYQKFKKRSSPFGIVYKDGKPIGVLEPISHIYEFQNFQDDLSKTSNVGRRNVRPPSDDSPNSPDLPLKRDADMGSPSTRSPIKRNLPAQDVQLNVIENNLKEIMSDLSAINQKDNSEGADEEVETADEGISKRDVQLEDEDLDDGMNRIDITKEVHAAINGNVEQPASLNGDEDGAAPHEIADYRGEGEKFIRSKRQQQHRTMVPDSTHSDGNDIVKGLEASGDLTVSGNKSPLASSSETAETKGKSAKSAIGGDNYEKRDKQTAEDAEYQKRLQRNIEERISQIKAQVKREINALKAKSSNSEDPTDAEGDALDEHLLRHKRNLNDQKQVDLVRNVDSAALVPHVRLRRKAEGKSAEEVTEREDVAVAKQESEDSLNKIDGTGKAKRELGFTHGGKEDAATAKRVDPGQEVRAHAASNSKRTADVVSNDELEKLVKDSSSLTDTVKTTGGDGAAGNRGTRHSESDDSSPAHLEVELHRNSNANQKHREGDTDAVNLLKRNEVAVVPAIAPAPAQDDPEELEPLVALGENHAVGSNLVVNAQEEIVMKKKKKRAAKRIIDKKHPSEDTKMSKTSSAAANAAAADDPTEDEGRVEMATSKTAEENAAKEISSNDDVLKLEDGRQGKDDNKAHLVAEDKSNAKDKDDAAELAKRSPEKVIEPHGDGSVMEDIKPGKRQERKSEPNLSLEDMQALDSENKMRRRRRLAADDYYVQADRKERSKRAQYPLPNYLRFRNYRGDEDEADDESDEFDDDNFDDRTANMVRKRGVSYDDDFGENGMLDGGEEYSAVAARRLKRHIGANERMAALHSGGPMIRHLAAIKGRNAMRRKRLEKAGGSMGAKTAEAVKNGLTSELSESDIFGALPQSYEGELTRFKRVKRDDPSPIDVINGDNSESP